MSKLLLGIEYRAEATESPKIWGTTTIRLSITAFALFSILAKYRGGAIGPLAPPAPLLSQMWVWRQVTL